MNIYKKLQKARVELQQSNIKKSGENKFAGYKYYELGDFLPEINRLFESLNLCSIVSFDKEMATMTIYDSEFKEGFAHNIVITSPMADAQLKGCHPIQNLGAVETYQRRYLYMSALEIVEADALDATQGKDKKQDNIMDNTGIAPVPLDCEDCGYPIHATAKKTIEQILEGGQKYYQKQLCQACISKRYKSEHPDAK